MNDDALFPDPLVRKLEESIQYRFQDREHLYRAMTHSSARNRERGCNERLEFLGDSILGLVISEYLYHHFPESEEGILSMIKSVVVSAKTLSVKAHDLSIDDLIVVGRGLSEKNALPKSLLCNAFEALIAAIYLDGGLAPAKTFILQNLESSIAEVLHNEHEKNYKSILQDYAQRTWTSIPVYRVTRELGPDHGKFFQVAVEVNGTRYGPAWGKSKKEAEQRAARTALVVLGIEEEGPPAEPIAVPDEA